MVNIIMIIVGRGGWEISAPVTIKTRKERAGSAWPVTLSEELIRNHAKWKFGVRGTTMWVLHIKHQSARNSFQAFFYLEGPSRPVLGGCDDCILMILGSRRGYFTAE